MVITDSRTRDVARPVFLTFDGRTEDGEPFAHMVENGVLDAALRDAALAAGAEIVAPDSVVGFRRRHRRGAVTARERRGRSQRASSSPPTASARGSAISPASAR